MVVWREAMWKVHVVELGKIFLFKICRVAKFSIQNLTRCEKIGSKSDKRKKSWFKIWQDENFFFKIMLFTTNFSSKSCFWQKIFYLKSCFLKKFFFSKSCFLKLHVKRKFCAFYGVKWIKTLFYLCNISSKSCFLKYFFSSKSCFLKIYSGSKSDAL